jgi:hypothetical protein
MDKVLTRRIELIAAWCGLGYLFLLLVGWLFVAGFLPMHRPSAGAEEIAQIFRTDNVRIRIGMVIVMWAAVCMIPFGALMANHVARFEAPRRTMTFTFIMAAFANAMLTFYPPLWWITASFRAGERSADLTYLLNDVAWLQFLGGLSLIMPMFVIIPVLALCDKSPQAVFPRWVGFLNLWIFVLVLPGQLLFFFYDGPFAWNGLIAIWIPLTGFAIWFYVMFHFLRKAALRGYSA